MKRSAQVFRAHLKPNPGSQQASTDLLPKYRKQDYHTALGHNCLTTELIYMHNLYGPAQQAHLLGQNTFPALVNLRGGAVTDPDPPRLGSLLSSASKLCPKGIRGEAVYTLGRGGEGRVLENGLLVARFLQIPRGSSITWTS